MTSLSTEIIRNVSELEGLRPDWMRLLERSRPHAVFLTPVWMVSWWEVYGGEGELFVIAVRDGMRLVGLLPCYITSASDRIPRQLRLLASTHVCSDHLDGLAEVGREELVSRAWQSAVHENRREWESMEWADLDPEGLLARALTQELHRWGDGWVWTSRSGESCPYIALPSSWTDYLAALSSKTRREIRHDRRMLEKVGQAAYRIVDDPKKAGPAMADFMRLHQQRRMDLGEQGSFADATYARFHARVGCQMAERGWLRLGFLDLNGIPVAGRYQFIYGGRVHDYLPGHDPQWQKYSIGLVLLSYCIEHAIDSGEAEVDLLRGAEPYKTRWATSSRGQVSFLATRPFSRTWAVDRWARVSSRMRGIAKSVLPKKVTNKIRMARRSTFSSGYEGARRKYVPFFPSTSPRHLFGQPLSQSNPFPLQEARTQYYYFARNGIWHAIDLLGLTHEDEVLMPAYNNGMEVAPFQHKGIPLRFVHVDRQMTLDLKDLEQKISPRSRLVYVIHYLGFPQPIEEIRDMCRKHHLLLFEDCALAFSSTHNGMPLGSFGDLSVFCLAKFLPVPNGGVLVLNNPGLPLPPATIAPGRYSVASQLTTKMLDYYEAKGGLGTALARTVITQSARLGVRLAQLKRVDSGVMRFMPDKVNWGMAQVSRRILSRIDYRNMTQKRRSNYLALLEMVRSIPGIMPMKPFLPEGVCPLFLPVLVEDNQLVSHVLLKSGISAGGFWNWSPPGVPTLEFPDSAFLRAHVLELQVHQDLNLEHLQMTANHLRTAVASFR